MISLNIKNKSTRAWVVTHRNIRGWAKIHGELRRRESEEEEGDEEEEEGEDPLEVALERSYEAAVDAAAFGEADPNEVHARVFESVVNQLEYEA